MKRLLSEITLFAISLGIVYVMYWLVSKILRFLFD